MGLIQSILAKATFKDNANKFLEIELNHGGKDNRGKFHLQNDSIRIEMNADEFIEFSSTIIDGANKLIETKKIKID
tara:strand:- start:9778 stop:10005 length:228 start_codon:yes stop_codon:yes gene_type:complete